MMYFREDIMAVIAKAIREYEDKRYEGTNADLTVKALKGVRKEILKLKAASAFCPMCGHVIQEDK